jgi:CRISPR-associated protein Cmr2
MIASSTWKGNLRWTMQQLSVLNKEEDNSKRIINLFANEREEEQNFSRGRLIFFPTFFNNISLEVINPHDRKTRAGTLPIYIESVPEGTEGNFSLLYIPFDLIWVLIQSHININFQ